MAVTFTTTILGFGNHASIEITDDILAKLGANKRAPLRVTVNGYTYQSTAAGMNGKCLVVFPQKDRAAAGVGAGDTVKVTLELDSGHREVDMHPELVAALKKAKLTKTFEALTYSKRKEFARQVNDAKTDETRERRIQKVLDALI